METLLKFIIDCIAMMLGAYAGASLAQYVYDRKQSGQ
jgi:hypothetical protein